jgi:hypothetical protein
LPLSTTLRVLLGALDVDVGWDTECFPAAWDTECPDRLHVGGVLSSDVK